MNAIPTSKTAEQLHSEQGTSELTKMFDNIEEYTGQLRLDLTTGKVERYTENLKVEWLVVDPTARQNSGVEPDSLRMVAARLYELEKVD